MTAPPNLEPRFLQPPGWQWGYLTNEGRKLRYGHVSPESPRAAVLCLQGLSEFTEKYFETARDCLSQNLAFYALDWMGQGKSDRYFKGSQKRHSLGYERDLSDLHVFMTGHVSRSNLPLALLAHSMGGHIGLRYMHLNPGAFRCAAFSAPLMGFKAFKLIPHSLALFTTTLANAALCDAYAPGFSDWREEIRSIPAINFYSSDPARSAVHNAWSLADPALQVGGITYGWLHETQKSIISLWRKGVVESIHVPCLIGMAGRDRFVSNTALRGAAKLTPHIRLLEFPSSLHEIIMEKDEIRKPFLESFFSLVSETLPRSS